MQLSSSFADHFETVIVNFADIFGIVCIAGSATHVATGQSMALRRMNLESFLDDGGGLALPHFYSHPSIWEPFTERDLDTCVNRNCINRIRDVTRISQPLIDELARGGSASNLPAWAEQRNNLNAATMHFLMRVSSEIDSLSALPISDRIESVGEWLESAIARQSSVRRRFADAKINGKMAPADVWLEIYEEFLL